MTFAAQGSWAGDLSFLGSRMNGRQLLKFTPAGGGACRILHEINLQHVGLEI